LVITIATPDGLTTRARLLEEVVLLLNVKKDSTIAHNYEIGDWDS
jgi:hypothetical protein